MTDATSPSLTGLAGTWHLDPTGTSIEFHTTAMWGLAKVMGSIRAVHGGGTIGDDAVVSGELVLDATSIDTKIKRRDKHLRSRDFLDVVTYPTLTFIASEASPLPDGTVAIKGSLRVKDRSHPVELVATLAIPSPERISLSGAVSIDRRQWGISRAPLGAGFTTRVSITAQFVTVRAGRG